MTTRKIIHSFLQPYKESVHFLKTFQTEGTKGIGEFQTKSDFYCIFESANHFTAIELQVCLNQLLYVHFAHQGLFDHLKSNSQFEDTIDAQKNNTFIIEQSVKFKKQINSTLKIIGEIEIIHSKRIGSTVFFDCRFCFNNGCLGKVKTAIVYQ